MWLFFKVYVNALQASKKGEKWKRNQSRHLHKTLVLHGYLHNKIKFRDKFDKSTLSLSVPYLSAMMQWSRNTVRRVVNTLVELGLVTLKLEGKRIAFLQVRLAERVREGYKQLKSRLFDVRQKTVGVTLNSINKPMGLNRPGKHATPAEHASYLAAMKKAQNHWQKNNCLESRHCSGVFSCLKFRLVCNLYNSTKRTLKFLTIHDKIIKIRDKRKLWSPR